MTSPHRKALRNRLPKREDIFSSRLTRPFAPMFDKPYFWTLNRKQAAISVAVGLFCGLMPGPTQMISAFIVAYLLRTNLPVAVFTTLYTNPITYMPLYYLAYRIGSLVTGEKAGSFNLPEWNNNFFSEIWTWFLGAGKPLLIGVPILGCLFALIGYYAVLMLWRAHTAYNWRKRHEKRTINIKDSNL